MKIVVFGLSITSSWGNGHATTYRALLSALQRRGHQILFFERDLEWYASNRDMPEPPFCKVHIYESWDDIVLSVRRELADCDLAILGSYFPDGVKAANEILDSPAEVKAFYDIDTPITISKLRAGDSEYLQRNQVAEFDLYFSFTGGPMLKQLEREFRVRKAVPLYCSFDPDRYRDCPVEARFTCDLSYMGTFAPDRQEKLEELLCSPARRFPGRRFLLAGPQYPSRLVWPANVKTIVHLEPRFHPPFYSSSRMTLNLTRKDMVVAGYSPSVRLFEAAGCGTTIVSDVWEGIETFLIPDKEILLGQSADEVVSYLADMDEQQLRQIGRNAQARVLSEHSSQRRATELETYVGQRATSLLA